ncbi:hypothetical protein Tco_0374095 [Tanacetum coccineum]
MKVNSTPDRVLESPSPFPIPVVDSDAFFEESDTSFSHLDNSLPEFETFSDHSEETRSGNTTTHANYSLPEYESFYFDDPSILRPPPEPPDIEKCFEPKAGILIIKEFKGVSKSHDFMTSILPTLVSDLPFISSIVWICQKSQEIKRTRERMSDQEAKDLKAKAREIMPQPSTVNCKKPQSTKPKLYCFTKFKD